MGGVGSGLRTVDWSQYKLERFEKNFYVEDKRVSARSDREMEEFRRVKEMKVRSHRIFVPFPFTKLALEGARSQCAQAGLLFR